MMHQLVDAYKETHGVEPMCKVLQIAPSAYRRHAARLRDPELCSERDKRDAQLSERVLAVWQVNHRVYEADKVWQQMKREQIAVARCTVERLMQRLGIQGVRRGKSQRTTRPQAALSA
jgi:putative transposase